MGLHSVPIGVWLVWCGGHDEYGDMVCPPAPTCSHVVNSIYLGRNNKIVNRKVECMRMTTVGDIIIEGSAILNGVRPSLV